jgi:ferredoxin
MMACNFGAIRRDSEGLIRFVYDNCVGCSACVSACPYGVIRYTPPPGEEDSYQGTAPYLGPAFQFLEKTPGAARVLGRIHNFTYGATLSMGLSASSISGMKYGLPRLTKLVANPSLSARALTATCLEDLRLFQSGTRKTDDLSIMVIRRAQ